MTLITEADFARLAGVHRSTVSRTWKQSGRLVMEGALVDAEASVARLEATDTDARPDMRRANWAALRAAVAGLAGVSQPEATVPASASETPASEEEGDKAYPTTAESKQKEAFYSAENKKLEYEKARGEVFYREDVIKAFDDAQVRFKMAVDNIPNRLPPEMRDTVRAEIDHAFAELERDLGLAVRELESLADGK